MHCFRSLNPSTSNDWQIKFDFCFAQGSAKQINLLLFSNKNYS